MMKGVVGTVVALAAFLVLSPNADAHLRWMCHSPRVGVDRCTGDFQWLGGTGKYVGLRGNNTLNSGGIPKTASG